MNKGMNLFFVNPSQDLETEDYLTLLKLPAARRVLRRLLAVGSLTGPSFSSAGNTETTAYNEGIRAMSILLAQKLEQAKRGSVGQLIQESTEEQ